MECVGCFHTEMQIPIDERLSSGTHQGDFISSHVVFSLTFSVIGFVSLVERAK